MRSEVITITPELAREMLESNIKNNRRLSHDVVQRYARIMKAGGWNVTHQGIAIDTDMRLIDGQHRLNAIIQANVPVNMMVTYDVEHKDGEAFTIDVGRRRTVNNVIAISGIDDPVFKNVSSYISSYMRWKNIPNRKCEAAEIIAYIERHYDECAKLYAMTRCDLKFGHIKRIPSLVGAALLGAVYRGEVEDALFKFCDVYSKNEVQGCTNYNAKHVLNLREFLRDHRDSKETLNRIESAIYAFANNKSMLRLRDNCYPYDAAMDA